MLLTDTPNTSAASRSLYKALSGKFLWAMILFFQQGTLYRFLRGNRLSSMDCLLLAMALSEGLAIAERCCGVL